MKRIALFTVLAASVVTASAAMAAGFDMISPTGNPSNVCRESAGSEPTSDPGVCRTDNADLSWYIDSAGEFELETPDREAASAGINEWAARTDIVTIWDGTPIFSGASETDVVFQEGVVAAFPTTGGITWCNDVVTGSDWVCDQHYVRIRGNGVYSKWLVAHEVGHALGLTHGGQADPAQANSAVGIMTTGSLPAALGSQPIAQVNYVY